MHRLLRKVISKNTVRTRAASLGLMENHDDFWLTGQIRLAKRLAKVPDLEVQHFHADLFHPLLFLQSMLRLNKDLRTHPQLALERDALLQQGIPVPDEVNEALRDYDARLMTPLSGKEKR